MNVKLKNKIIVVTMCIGIFLCMLDTTIMNIALPAIQTNLNISLNSLSWSLNVYTILFATLTIPIGKLSDIFGRNKIYLLALIGFFIGSIICGTAPSISQLTIGRAIQSISAAAIFPISMTIGISTADSKHRKGTIAALGVTQGLAAVLGPVIGGIITQYLNWRWIFFINLPLIFISFFLCLSTLKIKGENHTSEKIDWLGSLLSTIFLFSLVLALIKGNDWHWNSVSIISLLAISILSFILFVFLEKHIPNAMVNLDLFKNKQFNGSAVTIIFSNLYLVGVTVILPTFFTKIENKTELMAALLITPASLMVFIFSPLAALVIDRIGPRIIIATGFISMAVSYFLLFKIDPNNIQQLIPTLLLLGFGYGIIAGPITVLAAADFTEDLLTASQSISGVLRQIGITLAVAIFVSGLTSNIKVAKKNSITDATLTARKMSVDKKYQDKVILTATKSINQGATSTTTSTNRKQVIDEQAKQTISQNNLAEAPDTVKAAVISKVTKNVNHTFDSIDQASTEIKDKQ